MTTLPQDFCPYKGLQPYTENDRAFFFGRERDEEIIISNLYASQLTALYGASGVGKSSVLLAGVVPQLRTEARLAVVVFRNWQDAGFVNELKEAALLAVRESVSKEKGGGREVNIDASLPLDEFLAQAARALRGPVFFIFDQFEEYFLYHPQSDQAEGFEAEFARAVNRRDVDVNFLLSLREDGLSKLDRFQGRIPSLLDNMLRLEHLDRNAARDAVTKPLDVYNRETQDGQPPVTIEPPLIESLLDDLSAVKADIDHTGQGEMNANNGAAFNGAASAHTANIETPFLQMVLTRLWDEEKSTGSRVMRLATFEKLGRAEQIARTHLDTLMSKLTDDERNTAARVLRYLVTPSGTKIAQEPAALVSWSELKEAEVTAILNRLSAPDMRILRIVQVPNQAARYEIFHDVLAAAVLDWRRRITERQKLEEVKREEQKLREQEQAEAARRQELETTRRTRRALSVLTVLLLVMAGLAVFASWNMHKASQANGRLRQLQKDVKEQRAALDAARDQLKRTEELSNHMRQGQLFVQAREYDDALAEFDEVIKADAQNANAYQMKAYTLYRMGRYLSAIENFQQAIQIAPDNLWAHYNLALTYWADDERAKAIAEVKKVLAIDPTFKRFFASDTNFKPFKQSPEYNALIYPPAKDN